MSDLHVDDESRDTLIAYSFFPFLTPAKLRVLRENFGGPSDVAHAPADRIADWLNISADEAACVRNPLHVPDIRASVSRLRHRTLTSIDAGYPPLLAEIADPPAALFVEGDRTFLTRASIAVVGSRRASAYGLSAAASLALAISKAGVAVVSGLATGVDGAAHRAALREAGGTIAILGTGIDITYPRAHRKLAAEIAAEGLVATEFSPGTPPRAMNFPIRNRIISGLSLGTVIVEATGRSGSLITARMAAEQGREVFAVPGPIFHAGSEGPHRLIQYGAKLVHDIEDIFIEIPRLIALIPPAKPPRDDPADEPILKLLRFDEGMSIDQLAAASGRDGHELAGDLLRLESEMRIRALPGARYIRVS